MSHKQVEPVAHHSTPSDNVSDRASEKASHASAPRRRFLQGAGAAGVTAAVGVPLLPRRALAADKTLKILQWSHFVPSYDTWFDQFGKAWG